MENNGTNDCRATYAGGFYDREVGFADKRLQTRYWSQGFCPFLRWNLLKYACNIEIILNTAVKEMLLGIKYK